MHAGRAQLGGMLVQLLAFRRPDLVAGLVLVAPGHEELEGLLPLPLRPVPGCRGTCTLEQPVQPVLSVHIRGTSVQAVRSGHSAALVRTVHTSNF